MEKAKKFVKKMIKIHDSESLVFYVSGKRGIGKTKYFGSTLFFGNKFLYKKYFINFTQILSSKNNFTEVVKNAYLKQHFFKRFFNRVYLFLSLILSALLLVINSVLQYIFENENNTVKAIRWSFIAFYFLKLFLTIIMYRKYDTEKDFNIVPRWLQWLRFRKVFFIFDDLDRTNDDEKKYILNNILNFKENFLKKTYFVIIDKARENTDTKNELEIDKYKHIDYFLNIFDDKENILSKKIEIFYKIFKSRIKVFKNKIQTFLNKPNQYSSTIDLVYIRQTFEAFDRFENANNFDSLRLWKKYVLLLKKNYDFLIREISFLKIIFDNQDDETLQNDSMFLQEYCKSVLAILKDVDNIDINTNNIFLLKIIFLMTCLIIKLQVKTTQNLKIRLKNEKEAILM